MSRTIELCGLPGAGKSAVTAALLEHASGAGHRVTVASAPYEVDVPAVRRLSRKAVAGGGAALRSPVPAVRAGTCLIRSDQPSRGTAVGRLVQWQLAQALLRPRAGAGWRIVDEGLLQCLWSVGLRGSVDRLAVVAGEPGVHRPDVLVAVRVPVAVAEERLSRRASRHSRVQQLETRARRRELAHGEQLLDLLLDLAGSWAGTQVVAVDGTSPPAVAAAAVVDALNAAPAPRGE